MTKTTRIIAPELTLSGYFHEMWEARRVLWILIHREVLSRYRQTAYGLLWAILQPLGMMWALDFAFGSLIHTGDEDLPYSVFVICGLLPWQLYARTLEMASISMIQYKSLITKIYLPRIFFPLSNGIVGLIDTVFGVVVMLLVMLFYGVHFRPALLLLPLIVLYSFYTSLGLSFMLSVLNAQYRDVQHAISFLIRLGFFLTPVIYPLSTIPEQWQPLYFLNPITGALELMRWAASGSAVDAYGVATSFVVSTLLLIYSLRMFQHMEYKMVDVV